MFRAFGHHKSSILDGGLLRWQRAGFPVDKKRPLEKNKKKKSQYPTPEFDENTVRSKGICSQPICIAKALKKGYQQMVSNSSLDPSVDSSAEIVVDARSRGR
jgi:thiosulfate/3-mercaptopyruvate sulfurtransferase